MTGVTLAPESGTTDMWGTKVSQMQSNVAINGDKITGTLHYISEGQIVRDWGEGYFIALNWTNVAPTATSLKVGIMPSEGSGYAEAIADPDHNGMFKVTNKDRQDIVIISANADHRTLQNWDISGLVLEPKQ